MHPNPSPTLPTPFDRLLTRREVAAMLHLSPGTVANMDSQGRGIPGIRVGRAKLYRASVVAAWLESRPVK